MHYAFVYLSTTRSLYLGTDYIRTKEPNLRKYYLAKEKVSIYKNTDWSESFFITAFVNP